MPGPCSFPAQDRAEHAALNEIVCNTHYVCWPGKGDLNKERPCELITLREWLFRRNRLATGKTP